MPPQRSNKASAQLSAFGQQLVWAEPTDPSDDMPGAYIFQDELEDESIEEKPTPSATTSTARTSHARKKPEDHVPRPPNAFILFRSAFIKSESVSEKVETNHSTLSKIIGMMWKDLPKEERAHWQAKAKAAFEEHRAKFPDYHFKPKTRNPAGGGGAKPKRRVREVEQKDPKRCAKIAELLVEGKKGKELDDAIKEFDRTHVPEVIMRFDAPITEQEYRGYTPGGTPMLLALPPTPSKKKAPRRQPVAKKPIVTKPRRNALVPDEPISFAGSPTPELDMSSLLSTPETNYCHTPVYDGSDPVLEFDSFILDNSSSPVSPTDCTTPFHHMSQDGTNNSSYPATSYTNETPTELDFYVPEPAVELSSFSMENFSWEYYPTQQDFTTAPIQQPQPSYPLFNYDTGFSYDLTMDGTTSLPELELHHPTTSEYSSSPFLASSPYAC